MFKHRLGTWHWQSKSELGKKYVFFLLCATSCIAKTILTWMGWEVSQKNCNWLVERGKGDRNGDVITILLQNKGSHKEKGNNCSPPLQGVRDTMMCLNHSKRDRSRLHNRKISPQAGQRSTAINNQGNLQRLHPWRLQSALEKTPKNNTASAPVPLQRWRPPGTPPAPARGCVRLTECKETRRTSKPRAFHLLLFK